MFQRKPSVETQGAGGRRRSLRASVDLDYLRKVEEERHIIKTEKCGKVNVYVQGTVQAVTNTTPVFLTVHDIGCNHAEWHKLTEHPCMAKIKMRSVWIHFELPGQANNEIDLPEKTRFPTMQDVADDLPTVLNFLNIKYCVVVGEGAGANIVARFAVQNPDRVLGAVLINCVPSPTSLMKYMTDKIMSWKGDSGALGNKAEQFLILHKFGGKLAQEDDKHTLVQHHLQKLRGKLNFKNLRLYVESYMNRSDLTSLMSSKKGIAMDTLLVSGSQPNQMAALSEMQSCTDPQKTTICKINDCSDILGEAPGDFGYNLLLFCQGMGLFSSLPMSRSGSICE